MAKAFYPELSEELRGKSEEATLEAAIDAITAASNDDDAEKIWSVSVYKVYGPNSQGIKEPEIFKCTIDELEGLSERLRREEGTGKYRVRVRLNRKIFKAFDIEVERREPPQPAVAPLSQGRSELSDILLAMQQQQQQFLAGLAEIMKPRVIEQQSPFAAIKEMALVIGSIKDLIPQPGNSALETIKMGIELAKEIGAGGGGGNETSWMDILKTGIQSPAIQKLLETVAAGGLQASTRNQNPYLDKLGANNIYGPPDQQPRVVPQPTPPGVTSQPVETPITIPPALTEVVNYLLARAGEGAQPDLFAEWTLAHLPEPVLDMIDAQDDPVAYLAAMHPGIAANKPWFERLLDRMYDLEDASPEATTETAEHAPAPPRPPIPDIADSRRTGGDARSTQAHAQASSAGENESGKS